MTERIGSGVFRLDACHIPLASGCADLAIFDPPYAVFNNPQEIGRVNAKSINRYGAIRQKYPNCVRWHYRTLGLTRPLEEAEKWLAECESSADDYGGRPMPVRVLAARLSGRADGPTEGQLVSRMLALCDLALNKRGRHNRELQTIHDKLEELRDE